MSTTFHFRKRLWDTSKGDMRCMWCDKRLSFRELTVEHLVPAGAGGKDNDGNKGIACAYCNNMRAWACTVGSGKCKRIRIGCQDDLEERLCLLQILRDKDRWVNRVLYERAIDKVIIHAREKRIPIEAAIPHRQTSRRGNAVQHQDRPSYDCSEQAAIHSDWLGSQKAPAS